jgi:hypothetical protein
MRKWDQTVQEINQSKPENKSQSWPGGIIHNQKTTDEKMDQKAGQ